MSFNDNDISMIFLAKATGTFTFKEESSIYLLESLPDGIKLKVERTSYPTTLGKDDPIIWKGKDNVVLDPSKIEAAEKGVEVRQ